jgi:hypothetical protein
MRARAHGRFLHHAQDRLPLLLLWNPRQPSVTTDQRRRKLAPGEKKERAPIPRNIYVGSLVLLRFAVATEALTKS